MADVKLSLFNQALTRVGEDTVTSLTGAGPFSIAGLENYDTFVEDALENGTWKFATKDGTPTLLTAQLSGTLKYQWQIPADCLAVQAVMHCGQVLNGEMFDVQGSVVRTCFNTKITLRYRFRPDEALWPSRFRKIIVQKLEALFLRWNERFAEADDRDVATERDSLIAKHTEAGQRRNRPIGDGTIVERRRGVRGRR